MLELLIILVLMVIPEHVINGLVIDMNIKLVELVEPEEVLVELVELVVPEE